MLDFRDSATKRMLIANGIALAYGVLAFQAFVFRGFGLLVTLAVMSFAGVAGGALLILHVIRSLNHRDDPRRCRVPRDPPEDPPFHLI